MQKTYFITGSASGIGKYITNKLVIAGNRVFATDINFEGLKSAQKENNWPEDLVKIEALDVRNLNAWEEIFSKAISVFGRIDVCINNAGIMLSSWVWEQPANDVNTHIDVNLKGVIWGTQVASRHMIGKGGEHIINISSLAGVAPVSGLATYSASKFGVRGFSLAAAYDLKPKKVYLSVVCPDTIATPLLKRVINSEAGGVLFSGFRLLSIEEVGDVILNHVIPKKPLEVTLPLTRALLAKIGNFSPFIAGLFTPLLHKLGTFIRKRIKAKKRFPEGRVN
jgi:3-oxoacyl-[acyl-carrier protein] reductase